MKAYWFSASNKRLRFHDGRPVGLGITHEVPGEIIAMANGLHGAELLINALQHARSSNLYEVELDDKTIDYSSSRTVCASGSRTYLRECDAAMGLAEVARLLLVEQLFDLDYGVKYFNDNIDLYGVLDTPVFWHLDHEGFLRDKSRDLLFKSVTCAKGIRKDILERKMHTARAGIGCYVFSAFQGVAFTPLKREDSFMSITARFLQTLRHYLDSLAHPAHDYRASANEQLVDVVNQVIDYCVYDTPTRCMGDRPIAYAERLLCREILPLLKGLEE